MDAGQFLSHAKAEVSAPQVCVISQCAVSYADVQATHHVDVSSYTVHLQCGDSGDGSGEQMVTVKVNDSVLATWKFRPGEKPTLQDGISTEVRPIDQHGQETQEDDTSISAQSISQNDLPHDTPIKTFGDLHSTLHQPLQSLHISTLSAAQSLMVAAPRGASMFVTGEHGSGKTLGALISGLESIQQGAADPLLSEPGEPCTPCVLIVAPTQKVVHEVCEALCLIIDSSTAEAGRHTLAAIRVGCLTSKARDGWKFETKYSSWSTHILICTPDELAGKLRGSEMCLEKCKLIVFEKLEDHIRDFNGTGSGQMIHSLTREINEQLRTFAQKPAVLGIANLDYADFRKTKFF
jgi:hypothetical protein